MVEGQGNMVDNTSARIQSPSKFFTHYNWPAAGSMDDLRLVIERKIHEFSHEL